MTKYLLDANVVSETTKDQPNPSVVGFLSESAGLWLASMVVHELEFGLRLTPPGRRRDHLQEVLYRFLGNYEDRILPFDRASAVWAARFRANAVRAGRPRDLPDLILAGTAKAHDLTVATRNVRDFEGLEIDLVNPWESS